MTAVSKVSTGVAGLDECLGGGFPLHRSVLVCGGTGTGKTTLGVQFLMAGLSLGEPGILVSVDQKPRHVVEDARALGWDLAGACEQKQLGLLDASPYFTAARGKGAVQVAHITNDLAQQVRRFHARRLVIDSLPSLLPPGASPPDTQSFLRSLFFSLEDNLGCTIVMTAQMGAGADAMPAGQAEMLASGVLELTITADGRTLVVRKMRGTSSDITPLPFDIVRHEGIALRELGRDIGAELAGQPATFARLR